MGHADEVDSTPGEDALRRDRGEAMRAGPARVRGWGRGRSCPALVCMQGQVVSGPVGLPTLHPGPGRASPGAVTLDQGALHISRHAEEATPTHGGLGWACQVGMRHSMRSRQMCPAVPVARHTSTSGWWVAAPGEKLCAWHPHVRRPHGLPPRCPCEPWSGQQPWPAKGCWVAG